MYNFVYIRHLLYANNYAITINKYKKYMHIYEEHTNSIYVIYFVFRPRINIEQTNSNNKNHMNMRNAGFTIGICAYRSNIAFPLIYFKGLRTIYFYIY